MNYKKSFRSICIAFLSGMGLSLCAGCQNSDTPRGRTHPVLNARQKDILAGRGLSTDYDQLTVSQQNAILAIEALLQYAEKKYPNETFAFTGKYTVNPEWKPLGGTLTAQCSLGLVSIRRTYTDHGWEYSDNYAAVKATPEYEQLVGEYLQTLLPNVPFVLIAWKLDTPEEGAGSLLGRTTANVAVFLYTKMNRSELIPFVEKYGDWLAEKSGGHAVGTAFFLAQEENTLSFISPENIEQLLMQELWAGRIDCAVSSSGDVTLS